MRNTLIFSIMVSITLKVSHRTYSLHSFFLDGQKCSTNICANIIALCQGRAMILAPNIGGKLLTIEKEASKKVGANNNDIINMYIKIYALPCTFLYQAMHSILHRRPLN